MAKATTEITGHAYNSISDLLNANLEDALFPPRLVGSFVMALTGRIEVHPTAEEMKNANVGKRVWIAVGSRYVEILDADPEQTQMVEAQGDASAIPEETLFFNLRSRDGRNSAFTIAAFMKGSGLGVSMSLREAIDKIRESEGFQFIMRTEMEVAKDGKTYARDKFASVD